MPLVALVHFVDTHRSVLVLLSGGLAPSLLPCHGTILPSNFVVLSWSSGRPQTQTSPDHLRHHVWNRSSFFFHPCSQILPVSMFT